VIEYDGRDEETLSDAIWLTKQFKAHGLDMLNVSVGFSTPNASVPWGPAFLAPVAERVRREADLPVASSWGFENPLTADKSIKDGQIDLAMIGRVHLANPNWSYQAAQALKIENPAWVLPAPYAHWLSRYKLSQ
jgi:2,4-dienoyl-CoA reductase-like NADH-dependent reductase (Old Yellow Enzyme family)